MLGCIVAGEAVRRRVEEQLELWDLTPHWVVSSAKEAGLVNGYDHPARLGADRWVAMVGALAHMRAQTAETATRPMVVVMVGTAVTVEAISAEGEFLGELSSAEQAEQLANNFVAHATGSTLDQGVVVRRPHDPLRR